MGHVTLNTPPLAVFHHTELVQAIATIKLHSGQLYPIQKMGHANLTTPNFGYFIFTSAKEFM